MIAPAGHGIYVGKNRRNVKIDDHSLVYFNGGFGVVFAMSDCTINDSATFGNNLGGLWSWGAHTNVQGGCNIFSNCAIFNPNSGLGLTPSYLPTNGVGAGYNITAISTPGKITTDMPHGLVSGMEALVYAPGGLSGTNVTFSSQIWAASPDAAYFGITVVDSTHLQLTTASSYSFVAIPIVPVPTSASTGGTVAAGIYGVILTLVNANGETPGSVAGTVTTTGSTSAITIPSPGVHGNATGYYCYVTQANGSTYTRQQAAGSPTAIDLAFTLTAPPTSTGANPPTTDTANPAVSVSGTYTAGAAILPVLGAITFSGTGILGGGTSVDRNYNHGITLGYGTESASVKGTEFSSNSACGNGAACHVMLFSQTGAVSIGSNIFTLAAAAYPNLPAYAIGVGGNGVVYLDDGTNTILPSAFSTSQWLGNELDRSGHAFYAKATNTAYPALVAQAQNSSQTGDLFQAWDSTGKAGYGIDPSGRPSFFSGMNGNGNNPSVSIPSALNASVTAISGTTNPAITVSAMTSPAITHGQVVTITGLDGITLGSGYGGSKTLFLVTAVSGDNITISGTASGSYTGGGTVSLNYVGTTPSVVGTDNEMRLTVKMPGTGADQPGPLFHVAFGSAFPNLPVVTLTAGGYTAAQIGLYIFNVTVNGFDVAYAEAPTYVGDTIGLTASAYSSA
jgi:hypothetical protein